MLRIILLLFIGVSFSVAQAQQIDINTKLAAYFPFSDCTGKDQSPDGGSSGSIDSTILCNCGVLDSALVFDAANEDARFIGNVSSVFSTGNFTVSFYMKPQNTPSPGATQMVMSKQDSCSLRNAFWVRYRRQGQNNQSSNVISTGISQNDTLGVTLNAKLDDDRCWYHIVLVRDGVKYLLYVDGELRDQKSTNVRLDLTNPAALVLSKPQCPIDGGYYGMLDEIRLYNRAYTQEEIQDILALHPDELVNQDTLIYVGNSFNAQITTTCANSFIWSPLVGLSQNDISNPEISPTEPTTYVIRFNHPDGCDAYDTLRVNVIDPDTLDCTQAFFPNAFTPGFSSGRNDLFFVSNGFVITDFISFEIFDRWGGRVFNAASIVDAWDGTFGGQPVNPGIFLYRLRYRCKGEEKVQSGTVSVLR